MRCPIDGTELRIADRQGVEVDFCPQCRGVWLDRGALDKIIDRLYTGERPREGGAPEAQSASAQCVDNSPPQNRPAPGYPPQTGQHQNPQQNPQGQNPQGQNPIGAAIPAIGGLLAGMAANQMANRGHHNQGHYGHKKRKKHKGWFDEMFDFDD